MLRGVRVYHVTRVVHTSLAPGPFREGHAHMHKAHFIFIFIFPPFVSSSFFHNNMKRTHRIWSWNAMLTPCLATHARTDLKTSCHGFKNLKAGYILSPRSQLWSIAKPFEGIGSGTTFQSCQAKNLFCRKREPLILVRYQVW